MKKKFHVIFQEAGYIKWWMKGLKRGISHVWLIEENTMGGYPCLLRAENLHNLIETSAHLCDFASYKIFMDNQPIKYKLLTIETDVNPLKPFSPFNILSCVSLTKKIMGINKPFILTPYQLYNYLKERINE